MPLLLLLLLQSSDRRGRCAQRRRDSDMCHAKHELCMFNAGFRVQAMRDGWLAWGGGLFSRRQKELMLRAHG